MPRMLLINAVHAHAAGSSGASCRPPPTLLHLPMSLHMPPTQPGMMWMTTPHMKRCMLSPSRRQLCMAQERCRGPLAVNLHATG